MLSHAEDGPLRQVFAGMSQRSRFLRYHRATPALSSSMVASLVDIRPGYHVALAAEIGGEPVGIVRWIRHPSKPAHAEIAAEVVDALQGCGLGRQLAAAAARSGSTRTTSASEDCSEPPKPGWRRMILTSSG